MSVIPISRTEAYLFQYFRDHDIYQVQYRQTGQSRFEHPAASRNVRQQSVSKKAPPRSLDVHTGQGSTIYACPKDVTTMEGLLNSFLPFGQIVNYFRCSPRCVSITYDSAASANMALVSFSPPMLGCPRTTLIQELERSSLGFTHLPARYSRIRNPGVHAPHSTLPHGRCILSCSGTI